MPSSRSTALQARRHKVAFAWEGPPGREVELLGDFPEWKFPHPMAEVAPGRYACTLRLAPGIYRYRFRVDQREWVTDPHPPQIDRAEGFENGEVIVGGISSPLLFAPDRRHVVRHEDGRLVIHAEALLASPPLGTIALLPGAVGEETQRDADPDPDPDADADATTAVTLAPLRTVAQAVDRRLLRAELRLPRARRAGPISLSCGAHAPIPLPPPLALSDAPPRWASGASFYGIFVDRWFRSPRSAPDPRAAPRSAATTADTFYGGDLDGIAEGMPYLRALGVDAVVLTPVSPAPTPHRYDALDLRQVDPLLGGDIALRRLIEAAHARQLRVVLDVSATHVNEGHLAFQDLLQRQQASPYACWFRVKRFPVRARDPDTVALYPGRPELPLLALENQEAQRHAIDAVADLLALGVDGLRLDAMGDAPDTFWRALRQRGRAINPDLLLLGEVVGDRPHLYAEGAGADMATDFGHREDMVAFFGRAHIDAAEFWRRVTLRRFRQGPFASSFHLNFLDNHDTGRFASIAVFFDRLRLALAYLLFCPEPAWITYGTELGLSSGTPEQERDDAWPERLPMPPLETETRTRTLLTSLLRLRRRYRPGPQDQLSLVRAEGMLLVLERRVGEARLRALLNAGGEPVSIRGEAAGWTPLVTVNPADSSDEKILSPRGGQILLRSARL